MYLPHASRSRITAAALALSSCGGGGAPPPPSQADGCPGSGLSGAGILCAPPSQFAGTTLTVSVPALTASERLAVILVNAGGTDRQTPVVTVTGTGAAPALVSSPAPARSLAVAADQADASRAARTRGIRTAHEDLRRLDALRLAALPPEPVSLAPAASPAPAVPAAVGDTRSFCHAHYLLDAAQRPQIVMQKANATLRAISPGLAAQFWVTDEVWDGFLTTLGDPVGDPQAAHPNTDAFLASLGAAYDGPVTAALATYFGAQSDFDSNDQMMFMFADLGSIGDAFPVGYFTSGDLRSRDATCLGSASNGADILFLTDPATFVSKGFDVAGMRDVEYPGTMAHELQHNVNFNERCLLTRVSTSCSSGSSDDDWVNEGLSMVSEDAAGYGLATDLSNSEFVRVGTYLREYRDYSLTRWEGDPAGNYGGVHAFMRYWLDQEGSTFTRAVVTSGQVGKAGVESVLGMPLSAAMLRWTKAMVFSGQPFSPLPALDYDPAANWSPLHQTLKYVGTTAGGSPVLRDAYVDYTPVPVAGNAFPSVRGDGWSAFVTGTGSGGGATVTVSTSAALKPHVLVVRFAGDLPR
jgi:hypothetical protein